MVLPLPSDRTKRRATLVPLSRVLPQRSLLTGLSGCYPNEAATALRILQQERVGYYPDLDLAEVFVASTGDWVPVGPGNEKGPAELA